MTSYLLDTNVCIDLLRGKAHGSKLPPLSRCRIPAIVAAELWTGVHKSGESARKEKALIAFLELFEIEPFGDGAARAYGEIRARLETSGTPIGPMDLLIAAQARSTSSTVITANLKEFKRVPGLTCLAWG